ncbi:replication protein A 70 kDa DNA-binding subunit B [Tanacetum coccineum]|uniref:Replication protein A 70 kDa DNA-binding subunit B n=1 Tax=Tanacetum coccineum TaxID=301880 RepID=A0ABQ5HJ59_9ASTR
MEQILTQLCDLDPMLDDLKIVARCIGIWKAHPAGNPKDVWSLDCFKPFPNFTLREFAACDVVDVIGTVVSISDSISFNNSGEDKIRRSLILKDFEGRKLKCLFFHGWASKFDNLHLHRETMSHVVMILQLAKIKNFNGKQSISPALYLKKLYLNDDIPEIVALRQRYNEKFNCIVYAKIHKTASTDGLTWDVEYAAVMQQKLRKDNLRPVLLRARTSSKKNGTARSMAQ